MLGCKRNEFFISRELHMICTLSITQARGSLTLWLGRILFSLDKILPPVPKQRTNRFRQKTHNCLFFSGSNLISSHRKNMKMDVCFLFFAPLVINMIYFNFSGDVSAIPVEALEGERCFPCTIGCCSSGLSLCRNKKLKF